ncbi:hypothetical protein [Halogeometricum sp. CBA1124]|uniref:hypothetical protein n=1 Tax=Halogeometricum sp. CBA1124 TaxID=2668071 RepID=UPI00142A73BE|nr:hypothetical protein [Halogeometricum sp. CBA1124]MUV56147.1 hypothetical protein [Halogeometricum sp. CBA1124]
MSTDRRQIVTEELWRSVVWFAIGLFGWSLIITSSEMIEASALTAIGLPILTAALLFGIMVGIRLLTGLELKANTEGSQLLWLITGSVLGGFLVLYDVLVNGRDPAIFLGYGVAVVLGLVLWRVARKRQSTA